MNVPKTVIAWNVVEKIADSDAGGWLMEFTARNLLRERDALRAENQQLAQALDLLSRSEDAEWNSDVQEFLLAHGYVRRDSSTRYSIDTRSFLPAAEVTP